MKMKYLMMSAFALTTLIACGEKGGHGHSHESGEAHGHPHPEKKTKEVNEHDEVSLGKFKAGELEIEAAQGHGMVKAGKEGHIIIKLPYQDKGASVVRAWIGTEDRTLSAVGKAEYTESKNQYDIHAVAPSPLPAGAKWWVEIQKPDGTKLVGSIAPKM